MAEILSFSTGECYERSKGFAMCTYLKRRDNGMYYFRRDIPKHLQPIIGQTAWSHSLRTQDYGQAKRKTGLETVRTTALLDVAEKLFAAGAHEPAPNSVRRRADYWQREHEDREDEWAAIQAKLDNEREERIAAQEPVARRLRSRIKGSTARMAPEDAVVARMLQEKDEEIALLREQSRPSAPPESVGDSQRGNAHSSAPALPKSGLASQRVSEGKSEGVSITGLFEGWGAQDGIAAATVDQWRSVIKHLVNFLGHDDACAVSTDDLYRWRNFLRAEPGNRGKPRSSKTINGSYLAAASVTFGYGIGERLIPSNPSADVKNLRADNKPKLRERDFTLAERRTILRAALRPSGGRLSPQRAAARRWIPWICAYTGSRLNEITQARREDFMERDGVWSMRITPEAGSVKDRAARVVPIHEHLLAQGLREFVERAAEGPLFYDPEQSRGGKRPQSKVAGQRLAEWVREIGVTDEAIQPNHAWRHTFKTICREAEIEETASDYISGHATKGIGRSYGSNTLPALAKQLAKFPRHPIED